MKVRRVLVTDGEQRSALAVVRSLGRGGHRVYVASSRQRSLAGASRFAASEWRVASPLASPAQFVEEVRTLVRQWKIDVLIPVTDASMTAVLEHRDRFVDVLVPTADLNAYRLVSDKAALTELAPRYGITIPRQILLTSREDATRISAAGLIWPLVVKPARSVSFDDEARHKVNVRHVDNDAELETVLNELPGFAYPVLLQERIVGPGVGIFVLLWRGKLVAAFSHRRLREKPPSGGVSVYRESYPMDPELLDRSRALLAHCSWEGVGMVEYKIDRRTGIPYLMEINGRFWGSLQLAIDAGVDFPMMLLEAATSGAPPSPPPYRIGVRSRWWWGDVDQLLTRLKGSRQRLSLPPDVPGRWRALWDFAHLWRPGDRNEVFRWNDPRPFLRETIDWLRQR